MINYLKKPHPFIFNKSSVMLPGVITFLIIALLAPLNFQSLGLSHRIGFAILFGSIASVSVWIIVSLITKVYPDYDEKWTLGKEIKLILTVIFVIALFVFFLFFGFNLSKLNVYSLFQTVLVNTLIISFFPVVILVLFEQYNHQKKQWKKATEMNNFISQEDSAKSSELIQLLGENGKMELQLAPEELYFLKSDGNYVEVIYGSGHIQKKLVRNRLKSLANDLPVDLFFQCHKSYVVNKLSIVSVEGNARNFELKLRGFSDSIPVSRSKSEELILFLKT
jgi:hypothetical protein